MQMMKWITDWRRVLPATVLCVAVPMAALPLAAQDPAQPGTPGNTDANATAKKLIGELQSDDYQTRENARTALEKLGRDALPELKKALQSTTDPDLSWRLEELIEKASRTGQNGQPNGGFRVTPREMNPGQNGQNVGPMVSMAIADGTGSYSKSTLADGRLRVSRTPKGGETETREFKDDAEFKAEWPEVHEKFARMGSFTLRIQPRNTPPSTPQGDPQGETQPAPPPFPGPFGGPNGQNDPSVEDLQRRLQELLEQMMNREQGQGPNATDPNQLLPRGMREMLEDLQRQSEEMQRELEGLGQSMQEAERELRERLQAMRDRRPDPETAPEAFRRWLEEYQKLQEGAGPEQQQQERRERGNLAQPQAVEPARPATGTMVGGAMFGPVDSAIRSQLQLGEREGVLVTGLKDEGLLVAAGLQRYDVLLSVNNRPIASPEDVQTALDAVPAGSQYVLKVIRKKERLQLLGTK
ncbi:MAG: PDZ domain-containing protein [Planctomycetota bacterium]